MWIQTNPNPCGVSVGDCVIRAISIAMDRPWDEIFIDLFIKGFEECDMPNANHVWGKYLKEHGFAEEPIFGVTVKTFAERSPFGVYVLGTGSHVVAVKDGDYYDAWDSGNEYPIMAWRR